MLMLEDIYHQQEAKCDKEEHLHADNQGETGNVMNITAVYDKHQNINNLHVN